MTDEFHKALDAIVKDLIDRPVEIDGRRVRWCLDNGIPPFAHEDGGPERWQMVTDKDLGESKTQPAKPPPP